MNPIMAPASRMVQVVAVCLLLSFITTHILTTYECKTVEGMPTFNSSVHEFGFRSDHLAKHVPSFLILSLLLSGLPFLVWECIEDSRFHDEQRVSDNRKRMLISTILVIISVVTMFGIGVMSMPKPYLQESSFLTWGYDVAKSVCSDVSPMPAMLTKQKDGYLSEYYANVKDQSILKLIYRSVDYQHCTYVANHRNSLILLVLYWCHVLSVIGHTAEILIHLVCGLVSAITQCAQAVENARHDEKLQSTEDPVGENNC